MAAILQEEIMLSILLVIIYISFISLGLPDALLGSAWPSMYRQLNVPLSYAGVVSTIIIGGTVISSLNSDRLIRKFGTGKVTAVSVAMTAIALWGFSISGSFLILCFWAIPYGLGAGSVDAALNNFVALHYKARHMSWLHCFWGVGATLGPYIMGYFLTGGMPWSMGYRSISFIQIVLAAMLMISLPLWKKSPEQRQEETEDGGHLTIKEILKMKGAKPILTAFFCYCALEATAGLWSSSYMVMEKGISPESAAKWASLFYFGITFGRFLNGFAAIKLSNKEMIRIGQGVILLGIFTILLGRGSGFLGAGFILVGMGCGPIYPCMLHETPKNFGKELSQAIMGIQMACAYVGAALMPLFMGVLAEYVSIKLYPFYLLAFAAVLVGTVERVNRNAKTI